MCCNSVPDVVRRARERQHVGGVRAGPPAVPLVSRGRHHRLRAVADLRRAPRTCRTRLAHLADRTERKARPARPARALPAALGRAHAYARRGQIL